MILITRHDALAGTTTGRVVAVVTALLLSSAAPARVSGQDWPQWRGPTRDGVVPPAATPAAWPTSFEPSWTLEIGEGYASPIVANGHAFTISRQDPREVVTAVDLGDGSVIWRQSYEAAFEKNPYAVTMAKGPNATPLFADGRLFTVGVSGIVAAWSADDGTALWRHDFSDIFDSSVLFCGTAASPVLANGLVILQVGSDVHGSRVVALDPVDGEIRWTWEGPGPGYASPALIEIGGTAHVVTTTEQSIVGLDPSTGGELWSIPFPDEWHENIVTPVWTGTALLMSGNRQGTHAYRGRENADGWRWTEAWVNPDVTLYMSTPVLADGLLFGLSSKRRGQFVALDVTSGAIAWSSEGREGEHAAALLTRDHVVFLTNGAELTVARRDGTTFDIEHSYQVAESETWAVPVLLSDDILIRDDVSLIRLTPGG